MTWPDECKAGPPTVNWLITFVQWSSRKKPAIILAKLALSSLPAVWFILAADPVTLPVTCKPINKISKIRPILPGTPASESSPAIWNSPKSYGENRIMVAKGQKRHNSVIQTQGPDMALAVEVAGKTDVGCVRANNEDNFGFDARYGIFIVCDGMGGAAAGEVASKMSVDTVLTYFREAAKSGKFPVVGQTFEGVSERANALASAIQLANAAVF